MKRLITGLVLAVIGGMVVYGGVSYRAYITTQEQVYASWRSRNYVEVAERMRDFKQSFLFAALDVAPRYRDEFTYRLSWVEAALGNDDVALKEFQGLAESPFVGADANFAVGVLSLDPKNLQLSKDAFWRALTQDPDHYKARVNYELLLQAQKRQEGKQKAKEGDKEKGDQKGDSDQSKPGDPNADQGKPKQSEEKEKSEAGQGRATDQFRFKDLPPKNQSTTAGPGTIRY